MVEAVSQTSLLCVSPACSPLCVWSESHSICLDDPSSLPLYHLIEMWAMPQNMVSRLSSSKHLVGLRAIHLWLIQLLKSRSLCYYLHTQASGTRCCMNPCFDLVWVSHFSISETICVLPEWQNFMQAVSSHAVIKSLPLYKVTWVTWEK